jgi:hypothetical protein
MYTMELPDEPGWYAVRAPGCPDSTMVVRVAVSLLDTLVVLAPGVVRSKSLVDPMFEGLEWAPMPIPR